MQEALDLSFDRLLMMMINSTDIKDIGTSVAVTSRVVVGRVINRVVWWADVRGIEKHPAFSFNVNSKDHNAYITRY